MHQSGTAIRRSVRFLANRVLWEELQLRIKKGAMRPGRRCVFWECGANLVPLTKGHARGRSQHEVS
jgi:hypothetical protein